MFQFALPFFFFDDDDAEEREREREKFLCLLSLSRALFSEVFMNRSRDARESCACVY